jgi:dTDP-4-amino-4,6-dideoxygalactose transaminase
MTRRPALLGVSPIFEQRIPFVRPDLPLYSEVGEELRHLLDRGELTKGRHLRAFEEAVAQHLAVEHAIAVSSCTAGLMLTYQALGLTGDVVVPSLTFMATIGALIWVGAHPVFADVDPQTMNLDPVSAEAAITSQTTAIVAVHNFGNPAEMDRLQAVADRHGLRLILDAAHGFGSMCQGRPIGPQGDAQVYSLTPTKLLIAGEGGVVVTDNDELADKVRMGREYGNDGHYNGSFAGLNARLPEMNALIGRYSLGRLEQAAQRRNCIAETYRAGLSALPGVAFQEVLAENRSSYTCFPITVDPEQFGLTRDQLALALAAENIETRKYYYPPVHRQTAYRQYAKGDFINTDLISSRVLSLPIWSKMETSVVAGVCLALETAFEFAPEIRQELMSEQTVSV